MRSLIKYMYLKEVKMSYADKLFVEMCKDIIKNGFSTEGEKVRPTWEDGQKAHTIKVLRSKQVRFEQRISSSNFKKNSNVKSVLLMNCCGYGKKIK